MAKAPFPALAPLSALALGGGGALRSCPPTEGWWVSALALGGGGALTDPLRTRRCMSVRGSVSAIIGQIIPIADYLPSTLLDDRRHRSPPRMLLDDRFHRGGGQAGRNGAVQDRFAHGDFAREFVPDWT